MKPTRSEQPARIERSGLRKAAPALALAVAAVAICAVSPDVLAQLGGTGESIKTPPTPGSSDKPPLLLQYGVLAVLVLGTLGLSILRSKREVKN